MEAPEPRTFYRVVINTPPALADFMSYKALGKAVTRRNPTPVDLATWAAVSTYVTEYAARKRAQENADRGLPIGEFIAILVLPAGALIQIGRINELTGHCDLTGDAADLLAAVVSTVKV